MTEERAGERASAEGPRRGGRQTRSAHSRAPGWCTERKILFSRVPGRPVFARRRVARRAFCRASDAGSFSSELRRRAREKTRAGGIASRARRRRRRPGRRGRRLRHSPEEASRSASACSPPPPQTFQRASRLNFRRRLSRCPTRGRPWLERDLRLERSAPIRDSVYGQGKRVRFFLLVFNSRTRGKKRKTGVEGKNL